MQTTTTTIHPPVQEDMLAATLAAYRQQLSQVIGGQQVRPVTVVSAGSVMTYAEYQNQIRDRY